MSVTLSAPLTWTDVARRLAAEANGPRKGGGIVRRARLGRYGVLLEVSEPVREPEIKAWLEDIFPGRVQSDPLALKLEGPEHAATVPIELEVGEEESVFRPSFGLVDGTVEFEASPIRVQAFRKLPVAAAFSVKGGTGRTTTAVALALRWAAMSGRPVLLVDADLEAPGISYLFREQVAEAKVSLEDVIALAHAETEGAPATVDFAAKRLLDHLLPGNLFLLPLRRDIDELVGSAVRPEHLSTPANPFAFADLLASIAQALGCAGVVVDVRAGLVPLMVNLAMDPEVSPLIVTTLADQSLKATTALVRFLYQEIRRSGSLPRRPLLVVNRVPNVLRHSGLDKRLIEPLITELEASLVPEERDESIRAEESIFDKFPPIEPFAQALIPELPELQVSAATWSAFLEQLSDSGFTQSVGAALDQWIETELLTGTGVAGVPAPAAVNTNAGRHSLFAYADSLTSAENPDSPIQRPLVTKPLAALAERFLSEVPIAVSEGAKGTGKTLAARFFIAQRTWDRVVGELVGRTSAISALILPVCSSIQSSARFQAESDQARAFVAAALGLPPPLLSNATTDFLKEQITRGGTEQAWVGIWLDVIAWSAGFEPRTEGAGERFADHLRSCGKNVVAVLEGLEELYLSVRDPNVGTAMRAALVGLVQRLRAEPKRPLGLVVFARRDTIEASVRQNLDQFRREYSKFALTWTDDDILELAAWLANESDALPGLWDSSFAQLPMAEKTAKLELLWGRKLGPDDRPSQRSREAYTATWVIAVLSDLRGRLVPRDLIRLLANAAKGSNNAGEGAEYGSRLLIPRALRAAVEPTSEGKVRETEEEISELQAVFDKFRTQRDQVTAPLDQTALDTLGITQEEIDALRRHGIVFGESPPYEVPELFRRGLGLRHAGARRSVVNLYRRARLA